MKKIKPNPEHATPEELEIAKESTPDKQHYIRLYAMKMLLEGKDNGEVAKFFSRDANTITEWVKRYNHSGVDGLRTVKAPGRSLKLNPELMEEIKDLLLNPGKAGEDHWTIVKLHGYIREKWKTEISCETLRRTVRSMGFRRIVPRRWALGQNEEDRKKFLEKLYSLRKEPDNILWFCDETGIIADPRPRQRWELVGSRPRVPYTGLHIRQSVIGAVDPDSGASEFLVVPYVDSKIFQLFLDQIAKATVGSGKNIYLVVDNASWHKAQSLNWHHLTPLYLPAYSPDLNPIERLWLLVKSNFFSDWIGKSYDDLVNRIVHALEHFIANEDIVAKCCSIS